MEKNGTDKNKRIGRLLAGCTKTELALAYMPDSSPQSARRCFTSWIRRCSALREQLAATGYTEGRKQRLTPRMVRLVFDHLGEP